MNSWYHNEINAKYVQQRANDAVEKRRVIALASANQPRRSWLISRVLLVAGCWLVARGWQLQRQGVDEQVIQWGSIEVRHCVSC